MQRFLLDIPGYTGGHFLNLALSKCTYFLPQTISLCGLPSVEYNVLDCVLAVDLLSLSRHESSRTTYSASINLQAPFRCVSVGLPSWILDIHSLQQTHLLWHSAFPLLNRSASAKPYEPKQHVLVKCLSEQLAGVVNGHYYIRAFGSRILKKLNWHEQLTLFDWHSGFMQFSQSSRIIE